MLITQVNRTMVRRRGASVHVEKFIRVCEGAAERLRLRRGSFAQILLQGALQLPVLAQGVRSPSLRRVEAYQGAAGLLAHRVGETFEAIVTGLNRNGTFVRLVHPPVEGRMVQGEKGMDVGDRGWHATNTIDLNLVLRGRLGLALPDGITTVLEPGETVLQRGTNHQWRPVGDEPTMWFAVMFAVAAS